MLSTCVAAIIYVATSTRVLMLVQDLNITKVNAATGELLRQLTLDPTRDYQPTGAPKDPKRKSSEPKQVRKYSDVLRHHKSYRGHNRIGDSVRTCDTGFRRASFPSVLATHRKCLPARHFPEQAIL
jgi:hypothetical protein